jgi:hypothetical protein
MSKQIAPDKCKENGSCNVTHCQKPNSAKYFNTVMRAYYCYECACNIEYSARKDGNSFYPSLNDHTDGAIRHQLVIQGRAL